MGRYYFYTNPNELNAQQDIHHAFGPVTDPSDPQSESNKDKYRITNLHTTTNQAPAVAICDGTICIVEDDSAGSTVTIVLKPHYQPSFDFPFIKYFLFKGIKRSSIINGATVVLDADIPFTQRLDEGWDEDSGANPKTNSSQALGLAYTANFMHPIDGTSTAIFADDQPIDHLFYYPNDDFQLPVVRAGEYIGYFDQAKFGFEIVLERLGYEPEISLARKLENIISVDSFTRANPEPDDADYFMHWHEKEACLNYIDPCAFYGSFCGSRVFYKTSPGSGTGDRTKCNTPQEIYDGILKYFENRNKIYIDIRNDYNLSLNYFKDYDFGIRFQKQGDPVAVSDPATYQTNANGWPITTTDLSNIYAAGDIKRGFLRTSLRFPTGSNNMPLVYLSKTYVKRFRKLKHKYKVQNLNKLDNTGALMAFTTAVDISFPIIEQNNNNAFCGAYFKLNFYDQDRNGNPANTLAPSKDYYINGLFRPLDMKQSLSLTARSLHYTIWHEEALVNLTHSGGPSYISSLGIANDGIHTTLFGFPEYFVHGSYSGEIPRAFTTWTGKTIESEKMFLQEIFELFGHKQLAKQELAIASFANDLDVVIVENAPFDFLTNAFRQSENPEDYVFLMFENQEYATLNALLIPSYSINFASPIYIKKDTLITVMDDDGVQYQKLSLDASQHVISNTQKIKNHVIEINKEVFEYADS